MTLVRTRVLNDHSLYLSSVRVTASICTACSAVRKSSSQDRAAALLQLAAADAAGVVALQTRPSVGFAPRYGSSSTFVGACGF